MRLLANEELGNKESEWTTTHTLSASAVRGCLQGHGVRKQPQTEPLVGGSNHLTTLRLAPGRAMPHPASRASRAPGRVLPITEGLTTQLLQCPPGNSGASPLHCRILTQGTVHCVLQILALGSDNPGSRPGTAPSKLSVFGQITHPL